MGSVIFGDSKEEENQENGNYFFILVTFTVGHGSHIYSAILDTAFPQRSDEILYKWCVFSGSINLLLGLRQNDFLQQQYLSCVECRGGAPGSFFRMHKKVSPLQPSRVRTSSRLSIITDHAVLIWYPLFGLYFNHFERMDRLCCPNGLRLLLCFFHWQIPFFSWELEILL